MEPGESVIVRDLQNLARDLQIDGWVSGAATCRAALAEIARLKEQVIQERRDGQAGIDFCCRRD